MLDATPLARVFAARRLAALARLDPPQAQRRQLMRLVRRARHTRFGRDHGFDAITDVAGFQARVPLRRYEDFWRDYWQPAFPRLADLTWPGTIPYFAATSGTSTGTTKFIPVTRAMAQSNRRAGTDVLVHHLGNRPSSRVLGGLSMMLSGSVDLVEQAPGILSGDLTGISMREAPRWGRPFTFAPADLAGETDWSRKIAQLGQRSLARDIRLVAGTTSWLLLYFDTLAALAPGDRRLARLYPHLELVVHGGVSFTPYRSRFEEWLEGSHAELREVYPASEGFIAMADRGTGDGLRLNLDGGLFFEFVPVEEIDQPRPTRHWVGDVDVGRDYAIAVTTCAGLWSYLVGDTVRFVDRSPPRLLVTGRTSYFLSAFGEHLTGEEIDSAVADSAAAIGAEVADYAVGAVFPGDGDARGGHLFVVETAEPLPDRDRLARFARTLDQRLSALNDDYAAHRAADYGMRPPEVVLVAPGCFADWMRSRGKLGGQNKVPRVINDQALFAGLRDFAGSRTVCTVA